MKVGVVLAAPLVAVLLGSCDTTAPIAEEPAPPVEQAQEEQTSLEIVYDPALIDSMIRELPESTEWEAVYAHIAMISDMAALGPGLPLEAELSPTVNRDKAEETIEAYEKAMGIWSFFGIESVPAVWSLMSEDDFDWWYQRVQDIEGDNPALDVWDPVANRMGHCYPDAYSFCGYGNPQASSGITFQYNIIGSKYEGEPNSNTVAHEAVHFYQDALSPRLMSFTPCWYVEGQATLIGNAVSGSFDRSGVSRFGYPGLPGDASWSAAQWIELLDDYTYDDQVKSECVQSESNYSVGAAIFEYLYSNYSLWQIHELSLAVVESEDWEESLQLVLGTSVTELHDELADHLQSVTNS